LAMPALHAGLAPCGWGTCTSQAPTLLADDGEYWDDEESWDDGGYYDGGYDQGPWANVCAGFDTGFGVFDIGDCTPNLIGP
jgi:hypothetical protein